MNPKKHGYYWIIWKPGDTWEVAYYDETGWMIGCAGNRLTSVHKFKKTRIDRNTTWADISYYLLIFAILFFMTALYRYCF